jgi:Antitoxin VbhA
MSTGTHNNTNEQDAWDFAKNTLRLEGQAVSPAVEAAAQRVIKGEMSWDEVVAQVIATSKQSLTSGPEA